jgi:hypothetical protein
MSAGLLDDPGHIRADAALIRQGLAGKWDIPEAQRKGWGWMKNQSEGTSMLSAGDIKEINLFNLTRTRFWVTEYHKATLQRAGYDIGWVWSHELKHIEIDRGVVSELAKRMYYRKSTWTGE